MNESYSNHYNDEMEINLVDLMFYLLKQWKTLFVMAILGILLGAGLYMVKSAGKDSSSIEEVLENAENASVVIDEIEISPDVLTNMELAYQYRSLYEGQLKYSQNSVLMRLDPNSMYSGVIKYYISAGDNTDLIGQLYQNMVLKQEFVHELYEKASLDCEEQYVRELISSTLTNNNSASISLTGDAGSNLRSVVVTYTVTYDDEQTCAEMLDVIREKVDVRSQEYQEKYGTYVSEVLLDDVQISVNNSRLNSQKSDTDIMNTCLTNFTKLENEFTDEERVYYELVYLGRENGTGTGIAEEVSIESGHSKGNIAKWLLIGVMLGIFCWGGYYFLKYLLDKHIKYVEEVSDAYGLQLIGWCQNKEEDLKGLKKIRNKIVNGNTEPCSKEFIASALNLLDAKTILLVGNTKSDELVSLMDSVDGLCTKAEHGDLMQNDGNSIQKAKQTDGIVLFVQVGKTMHTEIKRELEVCRIQKVSVLGVVVFE